MRESKEPRIDIPNNVQQETPKDANGGSRLGWWLIGGLGFVILAMLARHWK
jgi:hypothetical protein